MVREKHIESIHCFPSGKQTEHEGSKEKCTKCTRGVVFSNRESIAMVKNSG